ncbi:uncharacterized protein [Centroberyx affinis]|uniref:uncharacterized protein isoform X2 n=1 Tax=Centroberyx affinis TaxID=166261 RepID=UPI003A5BCD9B
MSADETKLLFEGFLKKRKDTMKMRWAKYWFRLQNTTLFFYTKKNGSASHLRGLYYIYTSVREVQRDDGKRFVFEITMTNGKRKVLAAETAALRKEWMGHLWQAMHLSSSGSTHLDVCEQGERLHSSSHSYSDCDSVTRRLPARPLSAPAVPGRRLHEDSGTLSSLSFPVELDSKEAAYHNTLPAWKYQHHNDERLSGTHGSSRFSRVEERQEEGDYDVLPPRNTIYEINQSSGKVSDEEEDLYDVPLSNRRAAGHQEHREMTESIYDVPSSLLRKMSDHTVEDQLEEGGRLLEDMMSSLAGQPTDWGLAAAPSEGPYMPMYV